MPRTDARLVGSAPWSHGVTAEFAASACGTSNLNGDRTEIRFFCDCIRGFGNLIPHECHAPGWTSVLLSIPRISGRSHGLDMLRGLFAFWVVWIHVLPWAAQYQGPDAVPAGFLFVFETLLNRIFQKAGETHPGVLGFIVLSGYCIHRAGFREGSIDVRAYAIRRFFRIYPVYLAAIAFGMIAWTYARSIAPASTEIGGTASIDPLCVAARVTGIVTLVPSLHRCAFLGNAPLNTVMTEIWLYIAYPVLLLGIGRRLGDRVMWAVICGIWLLGVATITAFPGLLHWWSTASLPGFLLYWWIGAAAIDPRFVAFLRRHQWALILIWLAWTVPIFAGWVTTPFVVEGRKVILALLLALVIAKLDAARQSDNPIAMLGLSGYSLYAFHAPLAYTLLLLGLPWPLVIVAAILAGAFGYLAIEKRGIAIGAEILRRRRN